jgi:DnaJ like chaperone protein
MSFDKKYSLCRSCSNARLNKNYGLICNLTQSKPSFLIYCDVFSLNIARDRKVERKSTGFYADNEIIIWTILIIIFFIQFLISKNYLFLIILLIGAGIFYYLKLFIPLPDKIIQRTGWFGYSYLSLSAAIIKNKELVSNELKLVYQKMLREYGFEIAAEGVKFVQNIVMSDINIKEICHEIKLKYTLKDKFLLYFLLYEVAVINNIDSIDHDRVIQTIEKELEITERHKSYIKHKFTIDNLEEEKKKQHKNRKNKYQKITDFYLDDAYNILGVNNQTTNEEIKKAYRKLAQLYHPDKADQSDENQRETFKNKFQIIKTAYEVIIQNRKKQI